MSIPIPFAAAFVLFLSFVSQGCAPGENTPLRVHSTDPRAVGGASIEARSLLDRPLAAKVAGADAEQERRLAEAQATLAARPDDVEAAIWVGRRLGYLWRMNEAVRTYSDAIARHPDDARLYRHRGHRRLSLRQFDAAITDLKQAAAQVGSRGGEVEPDGLPNARNQPLTTTGFNIWYHLALARYLSGQFESALPDWDAAARHTGGHDDNRIAVAYWKTLTLTRLGNRKAAAAILVDVRDDLNIIENHAYYRLLLHFKGEHTAEQTLAGVQPASAEYPSLAYGVGIWKLLNGDRAGAIAIFRTIVDSPNWPAFGFIAAEAELARLGVK